MTPDPDVPCTQAMPPDIARFQAHFPTQTIFDQASISLILADLQGLVLDANPAACKALGYSRQELVGRPLSQFTHPDDVATDQDLFRALTSQQRASYSIEKRHIGKHQTVAWNRLTVSLVRDSSRLAPYVLIMAEDLRQSELTYRILFTNNPHPLWVYDVDTLAFLEVNEAAVATYGYSHEEFLAMTLADILPPEELLARLDDASPQGTERRNESGLWKHRRKDGTLIDVEITSNSIMFGGRRANLALANNISDHLQAEAKLRYTTLHDGLTDLPNRYLLTEKLKAAIKQSQRQNSPRYAVLFLDLDRFKVVNDNLGHLAGDQVLVVMANMLKTLVRETDLVARLSGDEFVILLEDDDPMRGAIRIAERLFTELEMPLSVGDRDIFLSTSIGIVLITAAYERATDILGDADIAMYRAKAKGRGRYEIFDADMHAYALQRVQLESDLHQALVANELLVHFQPIVSLQNNTLSGFEALVRWQHPQRGLVGPTDFITVAEEIGLIIPVDQWVLETVCQHIAEWDKTSLMTGLRVSINLSVQDLWNVHLIDDIDRTLAYYGVSGDRLTLEITESMLVSDMSTATRLINQLRLRGIHISIDDFGTGYSSLSYLHQLPADALKIDRSFVSQMQHNPKNYKIVETILALGHHLDLSVIAEGVETQAQAETLHHLGCEFGQGNWFAPALTVSNAVNFAKQMKTP